MAYSSSDSLSTEFIFPPTNIRSVQHSLLKQVNRLKRKVSDVPIVETVFICENVKNKILNQEDESHLSQVQNIHRKIQIASDLLIGICYFHREKVDCEFMKMVFDVLHVEKYKNISKKLSHKKHLELEWEKYFEEEAKAKIMKFSEEEKELERAQLEQEKPDYLSQSQETGEKVNEIIEENITDIVQQPSRTLLQGVDQNAESFTEMVTDNNGQWAEILPTELSFPMEAANLTDIRRDTSAEVTKFHIDSPNISVENIKQTNQPLEASIREANIQQELRQEDISHILQILDDSVLDKEFPEIYQPESLLNMQHEIPELPQERKLSERTGSFVLDDDDWSISDLEPIETPKKKCSRFIFDKQTTIPNYASEAINRNRNIIIERVQVFPGPPSILQKNSSEYLLRTPGFRSSISQDRRSSEINNLFTRHLKSERRPHVPFNIFKSGSTDRIEAEQEQVQQEPILAMQTNKDVEEEYRLKMKMMSPQREFLAEKEPTRPDNQINETINKDSFIGSPLPRIQAVPESDINKISFPNSFSLSTVPQLQGQMPEPKRSLPWFFSIRYTAPSSKWREFGYVEKELEEYWTLCEIHNTEKSISAYKLLNSKEEGRTENLLTFLRILDKLSIQRKLVLTRNAEDIVITPFEIPYVSQKQSLLIGVQPKY